MFFQDAMSSSKYMVIIHGYTIVILKVFEGASLVHGHYS